MKILFITEFFPTKDKVFLGGVQSATYFIVKYLAQKNEVLVISNREQGKPASENFEGIKVIRTGFAIAKPYAVSTSIFKRLVFITASIKVARNLDFDLVEGTNSISHFSAFLIGILKNKPRIAWYPDVLIGSWIKSFGLLSGSVGELSERIILHLPFNKFIAISQATANKLRKYGVSNKKIAVIGCGIDFSEFEKINLAKKKEPIICTASRLVAYKRIDDLIQSVSYLKLKIPNIKLYIIGDGPEYKKLVKQVERLNLAQNVNFFANLSREKFLKTLAEAAVFVLPSSIEGFGLTIIEAAALKIPYIVTDLPATREITQNGRGGFLVKVGEISGLSKILLTLIRNTQLRSKLGKEAYELSRMYNWSKIAVKTKKTFEYIIKNTKKPLKITILVDAWFPIVGGGQINIWEIARRIVVKKGYKIEIVTRKLKDEKGKSYAGDQEFFDGKLTVKRLGICTNWGNLIGEVSFLASACIYLLFHDFDLLHVHPFRPVLPAKIIALFKRRPIILTVHGTRLFGEVGSWNPSVLLEKLILTKIKYNLLISVTHAFLKFPNVNKNVIVIPNGIDISKFKKLKVKKAPFLKILWVGRFDPVKRVKDLFHAIKMVSRKIVNVKLVLVGYGYEFQRLKNLAKELKITNLIEFKGKKEGRDLIREYKSSHLFVLPSASEGQPLALLEAQAAGLPVVASDVGGIPEVIKNHINGLLVPPRHINGFTNAIILVSKKRKIFSKNAFENSKRFYSWSKVSELTYNAYSSLINET